MEKTTASPSNAISPVGNVVDVATRGAVKGIVFGLVWLLFGGGLAWVSAIAVSAILWERERGINEITDIMAVMAAISGLVAWILLATAVRRFRGAFQSGCYLRAGRGGLSYRIPGRSTWSSLLFGYLIDERHFRWAEIKIWYPYLSTINGIPSESVLVVETVRGGKLRIPTMYFSESRRQIADNINRAISESRVDARFSTLWCVKSAPTHLNPRKLPPHRCVVASLDTPYTGRSSTICFRSGRGV